jgi:Flp pilus assembly protein TadD
MEVLVAAQKRHPWDRDLLYALATMSRDAGNLSAATRYATQLAAVAPDDPAASELLRKLGPR